jgi:hypothetical protein
MKHCWIVLCVLALTTGAALAQRKSVPAPPKPADNGPSLEATMKFIQDKVSEQGKIVYAGYGHDNATGQDWVGQYTEELSNFVASAPECKISYHFHETSNGQPSNDIEAWFKLNTIQDVLVETREQNFKQADVKAGHPTWSSRVDPPTWVVEARWKGGVNDIFFHEEDMANRVAKALVHAVELCGGGEQNEPF